MRYHGLDHTQHTQRSLRPGRALRRGGYTVYTYMTAEDEPVSSELDKFVDF